MDHTWYAIHYKPWTMDHGLVAKDYSTPISLFFYTFNYLRFYPFTHNGKL